MICLQKNLKGYFNEENWQLWRTTEWNSLRLEKVMWVIESSIILQIIPSSIFHPFKRAEVYLWADAREQKGTVLSLCQLYSVKSFKFLSVLNSFEDTWDHLFHLKVLWGCFAVFIIKEKCFGKGAHCFCFLRQIYFHFTGHSALNVIFCVLYIYLLWSPRYSLEWEVRNILYSSAWRQKKMVGQKMGGTKAEGTHTSWGEKDWSLVSASNMPFTLKNKNKSAST